jgi:hypothetical protein
MGGGQAKCEKCLRDRQMCSWGEGKKSGGIKGGEVKKRKEFAIEINNSDEEEITPPPRKVARSKSFYFA